MTVTIDTTSEVLAVADSPEESISARDFWAAIQAHAVARGDLAGVPVPAQDSPLRLAPRHPYFDRLDGQTLQTIGEPTVGPPPVRTETIRNTWRVERHPKHGLPCRVWLYEESTAPGRVKCWVEPLMLPAYDAATKLLQTFDVAISWEIEPEERAMAKLETLVTPSAYRYYVTTGAFLETSPRSRVTYVFRRLRPTLALRPALRGENMRILAALCMHPLAWYEGTYAGAMVPTDDVIAHLLFMRGDEHKFWRYANQHDPTSREAGL